VEYKPIRLIVEGGEIVSVLSNLKKYIPIAPNPVFIAGLLMINGTTASVLLDSLKSESTSFS
jgi:hypothetical protein